MLNAVGDPTLLVEARNYGVASFISGDKARVCKALLKTYSGASIRFPDYIPSPKTALSCHGVDLTFSQVVNFLTEVAPDMERVGFAIRLPREWLDEKGERRRPSLRAKPRQPADPAAGHFRMDAVLDFDWQLALGDDTFTPEEFAEIARLKQPLVRLRGKWVHFTADELAAVARLFEQGLVGRKPARELLRAASAGVEVEGLPFAGVVGETEAASLFDHFAGLSAVPEVPVPAGVNAELRPYQRRGLSWLAFLADRGVGACLADDMGLGKTLQTLALIQHRREAGDRRPCLLVCPTSVIGNWREQARRFVPNLGVAVHHGDTRSKTIAELLLRVGDCGLVVTSYPLLERDAAFLSLVPWAGVVLDEAQHVKNPDAKQSKAARGLTAGYRVALSGTPVQNHVGDLWAVMEFLNPGYLGTRAAFDRDYRQPIQSGRGQAAADRLRRLVAPFVLRRLKSDPAIAPDLPEKNESDVYCTLTREQATLYEAVLRQMRDDLRDKTGIGRRGAVLGLLGRLKMICDHPELYEPSRAPTAGRSGKLARLLDMLDTVHDLGESALVFTQYVTMGEILCEHLKPTFGDGVLFLHGGIEAKDRENPIQRFQSDDGKPRAFVLSLLAGGTGLNLTRASHVFHYDRWWNPAVENQATDRAHRIGQTRNVQVHKLICVGTLEERIDQLIRSKVAVAEQVIGAGEDWLTELSDDRLSELVELRAEIAISDP